MGNFSTAVKLLVVFGLISLLVVTMLGGTSPFDDLENTLSAGVTFPEFSDPFTEETITFTSFIGNPVEGQVTNVTSFAGVSFHGCENVTLRRGECMGSPDKEESFVRLSVREDFFKSGISWNYSHGGFKNINSTTLRTVKITFQCRTEINETAEVNFRLFWSLASQNLSFQPVLSCPKSDSYQTVTWTASFPGGITPYDPFLTPCVVNPPCTGFTQQAWIFTEVNIQGGFGIPAITNTPGASARFSYFRIDVEVMVNTDCVPPEGAWFPALDEVACAIMGFANVVWKGINFLINGISFVLVTIGVVLVFLGQVVFGLLLGIINMAAWFLTVDAPDIVKSIFGIFTIGTISFVVLTVAGLIRGSGP